jgi:hypothetical protein
MVRNLPETDPGSSMGLTKALDSQAAAQVTSDRTIACQSGSGVFLPARPQSEGRGVRPVELV